MKLTAKVSDTHSASQYTDNRRRVTLKVGEADCLNTWLTVRSDDLALDEELTLLIVSPAQAGALFLSLNYLREQALLQAPLASVLDQLRPGDPLEAQIEAAHA